MKLTQSSVFPPPKRRNKLLTFAFIASLVAVPVVIQKSRDWFGSFSASQPVMKIHASPVETGDVNFETPDGQTATFAKFKGQYILVNVWATWCPPCRKEMPSLERLQTFYSTDPGFRLVALSVDDVGFDQLSAFYSVIGVTKMELYRAKQADVMQAFGIVGFPTTFLLDPDGKEIARLVGPTEWDDSYVIGQIKHLMAGQGKPLSGMN